MSLSAQLIEAYQNADYVVFAPAADAPQIVLRIGAPSADLDELLEADGVRCAAFVSPCNPRGRRLSARENADAFFRMNTLLASTRYRRYAGEGRDPKGEWPPETSVLIAGMPRAEAEALGRALEQNAIVFIEKGRPAELVPLR